jgi:hypothetical protein
VPRGAEASRGPAALCSPLMAAPQRSVSPLRAQFDILRRIEEESATGLAQLRDPAGRALGEIVARHGRVCLAVAAPRFEFTLPGEDPVGRAQIGALARQVAERKGRIGEAILRQGEPLLSRFRSALLRQTAGALSAMVEPWCVSEGALRFTPARDDYDERLTFSALTVLTASATLGRPPRPDLAARLFHAFAASPEAALLLVKPSAGGGLPLPLAARGLEGATLAAVVAIARGSAGASRPASLAEADAGLRSFEGEHGFWICAAGDHQIAMIRTDGTDGVARAVRRASSLLGRPAGPKPR